MPRTFFSGSNSETSLRSWGGGGLRVDVVIADGTTLAVPISESTTFATLQNDVLKRAAKLNIGVPGGNLAFRLDTKDGSLAFPTDTVTEVLDLSTRPLIYLCSLPSEEVRLDALATNFVANQLNPYRDSKLMRSSSVGLPQHELSTFLPWLQYPLIRNAFRDKQQ